MNNYTSQPTVFELAYWRSKGRMSWWEREPANPPTWHAQWAIDEYNAGRDEAMKREPDEVPDHHG